MLKITILLVSLLVITTVIYGRPVEEDVAGETLQAEDAVPEIAPAEDSSPAASSAKTSAVKKGRVLDQDTASSTTTTREPKDNVEVLKFEHNKNPDGSFQFLYETDDQTYREESGTLANAGTEDEALEIMGSYRYTDAFGQLVEVHYTAGKNGFVPTGTHILPEITALAKSAASLPPISDQEVEEADARQAHKDVERRSRARHDELEDKENENVPKKKATATTTTTEKNRRGESAKDLSSEGTEAVNVSVDKPEDKSAEE